MLFENLVKNTSDYTLETLLRENLMNILAHTIDYSLLDKADKEVLRKIVDDYEVDYLSLKKKTTNIGENEVV